MQSHPIPGSRYVGGYIGVGLEKQEAERLLDSGLVLICPQPETTTLGHKLNMTQIRRYR